MKINRLKKEDIKDFRLVGDDMLDFDKMSPQYAMDNMGIEISVDYSKMLSNISEEDTQVLFSSVSALEQELFNGNLVRSLQDEKSKIEFLDISDFDRLELTFKKATTKQEIEKTLEVLNELVQDKIDFNFGKNNEKLKKQKEEYFLQDRLIDIENDLIKRIVEAIKKDYSSEVVSVLLNACNTTQDNNTNNELYGRKDESSTLTFFREQRSSLSGRTEGQQERSEREKKNHRKIEDKLDAITDETGFIDDYYVDCGWKFRYRVELSDNGLEYLDKIKKEETKKYYKENNLDPKTHFKREKRKNVNKMI